MKPIFCIVGKSGSGKTTYLKALMKNKRIKLLNIQELKYHTTRSKRYPEEDSYHFATYKDYNNTPVKNIIESRKYKKIDEDVIYYTTTGDIYDNDAKALICAASVDQAISYYNKLDNVYIIDINVATKDRLIRLIDRCKSENEYYEVCRRTIEENNEYNNIKTIYDNNFEKIIKIDNNNIFGNLGMKSTIKKNINIIIDFITKNI